MDSKLHSKVINGPVKIKKKEGSAFSAYGDYINGKTLQLIPDKLIVQSWWASDWDTNETISTFILLFEQRGKDAVVCMTHANVPDVQYQSLKNGWNLYYWKPLKAYLKEKEKKNRSILSGIKTVSRHR
jgi:activator of HSP90 ATPase